MPRRCSSGRKNKFNTTPPTPLSPLPSARQIKAASKVFKRFWRKPTRFWYRHCTRKMSTRRAPRTPEMPRVNPPHRPPHHLPRNSPPLAQVARASRSPHKRTRRWRPRPIRPPKNRVVRANASPNNLPVAHMSKRKFSSQSASMGMNPWTILIGLVIVFLVAAVSILFGGFHRCDGGTTPPTTAPITGAPQTGMPVTSLPRAHVSEGDWYTVYFTIPTYPEKKDDRKGGVDEAIIGDLERAQKTIDAAVFDFRLPSLTDAFIRAAQRGVRVRLVTDYAANQDAKEYTDAIAKMEQGGVNITRDHRSALMHNKFVIIDNRLLWTGSMNFTPNDVYRNNNNMLRLAIPALIENYSTRFERLFQSRATDAPSKQV